MPVLSSIKGCPVFDADERRVGKLKDLVIGSEVPYPSVTAIVVSTGKGDCEVPWGDVASVGPGATELSVVFDPANYLPPAKGPVLLVKHVMDHQIVDTTGAKLVRVNDIGLAMVDHTLRVEGIDSSGSGVFRRLGFGRFARGAPVLIDWAQVDITHLLPEVHLKVPHEGLRRMHPADIAHVLSKMRPARAANVFGALDDTTAARALSELPDRHQPTVLTAMLSQEAVRVLEEMDPAHAVDLLKHIPKVKAEALMTLMDPTKSAELRPLLAYPNWSAGGLMSPRVIRVAQGTTMSEALDAVRTSRLSDRPVDVFVVDPSGRLVGQLSLVALIAASPAAVVEDGMLPHPKRLQASDRAEDVLRLFVHYRLLFAPVVDDEQTLIGVVSLTDLIDSLSPRSWHDRPQRREGQPK